MATTIDDMEDFVLLQDEAQQLPDLIPIVESDLLIKEVAEDKETEEDKEAEEDKEEDRKIPKNMNLKLTDFIPQNIKTKVYYGFTATSIFMVYVIGKLIYKFIMW